MSLLFGTHPANIPQFYLFYSGGLYYYGSSCCVPPEHWGVVVSTKFLTPDQLGCHPTPIPGSHPPGPSTATTSNPTPKAIKAAGPSPVLTKSAPHWSQNVPTNIYAMDNIGNANILPPTEINYSLHGVLLKKVTENVQFDCDIADKHFIENRFYKLSHFEVSYFKTSPCPCPPANSSLDVETHGMENDTPQAATPEHDDAENPAGSATNHVCQTLVHYHLLLAECAEKVDGTLSTVVSVDVEASPVWTDPTNRANTIAAGRLLRLTGTRNEYKGAIILVVNNV